LGEQASSGFPATGATRVQQIVGTVGDPSQATQTSRKSERQAERSHHSQSNAVFGHVEDPETASFGAQITDFLACSSVLPLFYRTSF
jgi:hypothetical protein